MSDTSLGTDEVMTPNTRPATPPQTPSQHCPKWEQRLPSVFVIQATDSFSIQLKVGLQTTDTSEHFSVKALLDSGATNLFIDRDYVNRNCINTCALTRPVPIQNVDSTLNEASEVWEVVDLILHYEDHTKRAMFVVTGLGKQDVILGYTWLQEHNPEVDWTTSQVKMSRCKSQCHTCTVDTQKETLQERKIRHKIHQCQAGPFPQPESDSEKEDGQAVLQANLANTFPDIEIHPTDHLFAWCAPEGVYHVRAMGNVSQCLAEAAGQAKPTNSNLPEHLAEFKDVFSKLSFDQLPDK